MNITRIIALASMLLLLTGCVPVSIHPLFDTASLTQHEKLPGTWIDPDDPVCRWTYELAGENLYRLTVVESDQPDAVLDAHLLRLDDDLYLDLIVIEAEAGNDMLDMHLLPVHTFYQVAIQDNEMRVTVFDLDWLQEAIDSGKLKIPHAVRDGSLILTASTPELQQLVREHAEDAFDPDQSTRFVRGD